MPEPEDRSGRTSLLNTKSEFRPPPFCSVEIRRGSKRGLPHLRGWVSAPLTADSMQVSSRKHPHTTGRNQACQPLGHSTACSGIPETDHEPKWRERKGPGAGPRGHPSRFLIPPGRPQAKLMREEGVGKDVVLSV